MPRQRHKKKATRVHKSKTAGSQANASTSVPPDPATPVVAEGTFTPGLRIANVKFVVEQCIDIAKHSTTGCDIKYMVCTGKVTEGLKLGWQMDCRRCRYKTVVYTEEGDNRTMDVILAERLIRQLHEWSKNL